MLVVIDNQEFNLPDNLTYLHYHTIINLANKDINKNYHICYDNGSIDGYFSNWSDNQNYLDFTEMSPVNLNLRLSIR